MSSGIYAIRFKGSKKKYIGSTNSFKRRFKEHLLKLRQGKHKSKLLQAAFDTKGESSLEFSVLEECIIPSLIEREQFHLDKTKPNLLLNTQRVVGSWKGVKLSSEHRAKISAAAKKQGSDPEERKRRSERAMAQHALRRQSKVSIS